jgi:carbonic anhydrase
MRVLREVEEEMRTDPEVGDWVTGDPAVLGVDKFSEYGMVIVTYMQTRPDTVFQTRRELLRRIKKRFDEEGIEISVPNIRLLALQRRPQIPQSENTMIPARDALERLREGNQRFVSGVRSVDTISSAMRRDELVAGQAPFAIILGCSDSRVPAEMVFDQGVGDLFVIRVAGNVVAPSQVGSVEFAAERFATQLVVVLGHTMCGAIEATLEELGRPSGDQSPNLRSIVGRVRPAVAPLLETELASSPDELLKHAVKANIRASANHLRHGSQILEQLIHQGRLAVVGAEYSLETGEVEFFDGVPL